MCGKMRKEHNATQLGGALETDSHSTVLSLQSLSNLIVKYNFTMNAYEIYNMSLPAELTVMSACNTGFGQLAEGEGVISLGRAFSYAGCQSVMMSLWMANDQSTAKLMDHFYKNLSQGQTKNGALKNAKLTYLENADPLTAHPYFWAGLVSTGDLSPLVINKTNYLLLGVIGFVGALLLLVVVRR